MTADRFDNVAIRLPYARITAVDVADNITQYTVVDRPIGAGIWVVRALGTIPQGDTIGLLEAVRTAERVMSLIKPKQLLRVSGPADYKSVPSGRAPNNKRWVPQDKRIQALLAATGGNTDDSTISLVGDLMRQNRIFGPLPVSLEDRRCLGYAVMALGVIDTKWLTTEPSVELLELMAMPLGLGPTSSVDRTTMSGLPRWKRNALFAAWREEQRKLRGPKQPKQ